jgi:sigma-B regulation protein RsbU (phosphoserine phosphatase)
LDIVAEFKHLLEQIDKKEYGKCTVCEGEVELERLEQDCTTSICLDCYSEDQLRELERDLELAAKVQNQLLPSYIPSIKDTQIAVKYESARIVGGDYYDFFSLKNGYQGVAIGDVMGKGLPASMLMSNLQASLRILGSEYEKLEQLAAHLNRLFRYNLTLIRFISLFLGAINLATKEFIYCNAGQHSPLWWKADTKSINYLKPTAPAIGLIPEIDFKSKSIRIRKDDVLLLYTDGLIEARDQNDEEYSEARLSDYLKKNNHCSAEDILSGLWKDVKNFAKKNSDDRTAMVIKFE